MSFSWFGSWTLAISFVFGKVQKLGVDATYTLSRWEKPQKLKRGAVQ
jgi:hypothetical protein